MQAANGQEGGTFQYPSPYLQTPSSWMAEAVFSLLSTTKTKNPTDGSFGSVGGGQLVVMVTPPDCS